MSARPAAVPEGDPIIKLAVLAVGGQGGGVITDWIVHLAERNGWYAQSTSVPGVAQRTGATIYYVEMVPERGDTPVLSLMPAPGDVDIVLAAELMEAGRAIQRGFVTPDRTTLVTSTHRVYAMTEKIALGDARHRGHLGDVAVVLAHIDDPVGEHAAALAAHGEDCDAERAGSIGHLGLLMPPSRRASAGAAAGSRSRFRAPWP